MLIKPYKLLFYFGVLTILIVGNATYFFGINKAIWLPQILGFPLYFIALAALQQNSTYRISNRIKRLFQLTILFLVIVALSAIVNAAPILQVITGGKNLFLFWSVFFLITFSTLPVEKIERLILLILPVVIIQIPFVLYQRFFIASNRSSAGGSEGVSWDAVVGTFGGDPLGGGASGTLAFFISFGIILALALWNRKQLSFGKLLFVIFSGFLCIALAEVKVVLVLIPLGVLIISLQNIKEKPMAGLFLTIASVILCITLLYFYSYINEGSVDSSSGNVLDVLDSAFWYSLDDKYINFETKEMGRMAALGLWWTDGFLKNILYGLIGYGPGASRSLSTVAIGEIASKYSFYIDRSSAVQVLWDIGLVGLIILFAILVSGCRQAYLLSKKYAENPKRQAILVSISSMFAMTIMMLPYSREFLEVSAMSFIVMVGLGFIVKVSLELDAKKFSLSQL